MDNKKFTSLMLIDDNEIDNLINQKIIESCNICNHIFMHTSAKSAVEFLRNVEKVEKWSKEMLPEIIFLDIDMPLMDGFQFLEEFNRLNSETKKRCKIVMLTSSNNEADITRAQKSSYVAKYITKPLTEDNLMSL